MGGLRCCLLALVVSACGRVGFDVPDGFAPTYEGYLKASNVNPGDSFGNAIARSADGTTIAVAAEDEASAAPGIDGDQTDNSVMQSGAVYVFRRGTAGWMQEAYVKASNPGVRDSFGESVALSADGSTLAVGAPGESSGSPGIDGDQTDDALGGAGAVYVFARTPGGWSQQAYVKASVPGYDAEFGMAVSVSADGSTLAASAFLENSAAGDAGALYVFARTGTTWAQQARLVASNAGPSDEIGVSIQLSADGNLLAAGADGEASGDPSNPADRSAPNAGAVYIFAREGTSWTQQAYLKAAFCDLADLFGESISLSDDGTVLAVGAHGDDSASTGAKGASQTDNSLSNAGAVHMFRRTGTTWTEEAYLKASATDDGDVFGYGVGLSGDGAWLAVAAPGDDSGGSMFGADPTDNSQPDSGAVHVFHHEADGWAPVAYVKAVNAGPRDSLGSSWGAVALSPDGSSLVVGASGEASNGDPGDDSMPGAGAVYVIE